MKALKWRAVEAELAKRPAATQRPARGRDEFWSDFAARARLVRQEEPAAAMPAFPRLRWAYAAAVAVLVVGLAVWFPFRKAEPVAANPIRSFEVIAPHTGVIIMEDEQDRGTILWVTGLNLNSAG